MADKPFIHTIKSPYNNYFFDVNTDSIVPVSDSTYEYLENLEYGGEEKELTEDIEQEMECLKMQGYLNHKRPTVLKDPRTEEIEYYLNNRLAQIIFQVTQQCNFRCSYCGYTSGDNILERTHANRNMDWNIAKKALEFFSQRVRDSKFVNVCFYGGEPLLELDLIKKIISYSKECMEGKGLRFNMTTNAALLTPEVFRYLADEKVSIMVSLDGPAILHNKGRKLAVDGTGSFDLVYQSLLKIKEKYPAEYKELIMYNCVVGTDSSILEIEEFFKQPLFEGINVLTPVVEPSNGTSLDFENEFLRSDQMSSLLGLMHLQGLVEEDEIGSVSKSYCSSIKKRGDELTPMEKLPDKIGRGGPCLSGIQHLFVTYDGKFLPCEKVSGLSDAMCIGNYKNGFDYEKVCSHINLVSLTPEQCRSCWALLHCFSCANHADGGEELSQEMILEKCNESRDLLESEIKSLIALDETRHTLRNHYVSHI